MNDIFELVKDDDNQVVVKVNAKDPLTVAMNPYVESDYMYVTVTKGEKHTLTVVKEDGKTFSFHWGIGGHTIISNNKERLRDEICRFIEDNRIMLEYDGGKISGVSVFYNSYYEKYEVSIDRVRQCHCAYFSSTARSIDDIKAEAEGLLSKIGVKCKGWRKQQAQTGIWVYAMQM